MSSTSQSSKIFAAIDVGTNASRLKMVTLRPDGSFSTVHKSREAIRPGEGVFETGKMARPVADRLVDTIGGYAAFCERWGAQVRAVATSAMREARNADKVQERIEKETGVHLEVISGIEEAALICKGVLHWKSRAEKSIVFDIGGGSTEVIHARGDDPIDLYSLRLGTVRLTELFDASDFVPEKQLEMMREYVREEIAANLPAEGWDHLTHAYGSSGTIRALADFTPCEMSKTVPAEDFSIAVEELAEMTAKKRYKFFHERRADIIVAGAVVLEGLMEHLGVDYVHAVKLGLREGILFEMMRAAQPTELQLELPPIARQLGKGS